jgi:hypothetical protein
MKQMKRMLAYCLLLLVPCAVLADQASDMMKEYMNIGENTARNFPKELEGLMPKWIPVISKTYVYEETQSMFLCLGIQGEKKHPGKGLFNLSMQVGVMGYNPRTALYMSATWPQMARNQKQYGRMDGQTSSGNMIYEPVTKSTINGADVYIQKLTHKHYEIGHELYADFVYYTAEAWLFKNNMMITMRIVNMPDKIDSVNAAVREATAFFLATNWDKYMK